MLIEDTSAGKNPLPDNYDDYLQPILCSEIELKPQTNVCIPTVYHKNRKVVHSRVQNIKRPSCDNVAVFDFLKILIFLVDGNHSRGSLQWRSSGSESLPLCFGHFPTS